jgi:uncharacterized protein YbjT (DUF2867 family)
VIVVTGATGNIGSRLVTQLLQRGEKVRVIARNPAKLPLGVQSRVEMIEGSSKDVKVLNRAFEGAERLFWLIPPPFNAHDIVDHFMSFASAAAKAIKAQGVQRVVAVSGLYGRRSRASSFSASSASVDDLVRDAVGNYCALQCASFMENVGRQVMPIRVEGMFFQPLKADVKIPYVATRDVAAAAESLLIDQSWTGHRFASVMGPEDLSCTDMARTMSEVLGKSVRYQQISDAAFKPQMIRSGASTAVSEFVAGLLAEANENPYGTGSRTPESTTPYSFREWCTDVLKPAVS